MQMKFDKTVYVETSVRVLPHGRDLYQPVENSPATRHDRLVELLGSRL